MQHGLGRVQQPLLLHVQAPAGFARWQRGHQFGRLAAQATKQPAQGTVKLLGG